ncbi:Predicted ATPase [Billgrantia gudaonensis]|uniref:Predicted ATPase n=2 Tax=Billgrantia gudaonensis TaxID=376427 RepID=A0A1G9DTD7_9GAMM|nr:Predicted ATPase [Halomonas gudaonensis]
MEEKTKGPILWFGNYVDFGDFDAAINALRNCDEIFFDFDLSISRSEDYISETFDDEDNLIDIVIQKERFSISPNISIGVSNYNNTTSASSLKIELDNTVVDLKIKNNDVYSFVARNDKVGYEVEFEKSYRVIAGSLIPRVIFKERSSGKRVFLSRQIFPEIVEKMKDYLMSWHHKTKQPDSVLSAIKSMGLMGKEEGFSYFKKAFYSNSQFQKNVEGYEDEVGEVIQMYNLCLHITDVVQEANSTLNSFFLGVRYLGPVRASAERFYRYQDLQVDEIDHLGSNLPMVINSLDSRQKSLLKNWMEENFGFSLEMSGKGSHYALLIKEEGEGKYFNISDMGFGYSQVLPIVVSIWLEKENIVGSRKFNFSLRPFDSLIVIEQPELHLHPLLQYKFAAAIAKLSSLKSKRKIRFVFETHSNHIIEAFGDAIEREEIESKNLGITIFNKTDEGLTETKSSGFDEDGYLIDWPAGFLSA